MNFGKKILKLKTVKTKNLSIMNLYFHRKLNNSQFLNFE